MSAPPALSDLTDQQVVAHALKRHKGSWTELVRRYGQRVYLVIYSVVGTEERARDLTEDTFFKVAMFLKNYHSENSFAAWILTIAHRTAVDYVKKKRPRDSVTGRFALPLSAIESVGKWASDPFDEPTPDPGTDELRQELEIGLSKLTPVQRKCVELHVLERRSYQEIAESLRLPVGTVKSHFNRAIKKLRTLLSHVLDSSDPDLQPLHDPPE